MDARYRLNNPGSEPEPKKATQKVTSPPSAPAKDVPKPTPKLEE